jgi:hypothetical protein
MHTDLNHRLPSANRPHKRRQLLGISTQKRPLAARSAMPGKPSNNGQPSPGLYCAVMVKRVDEKTRSKTSINELLRD